MASGAVAVVAVAAAVLVAGPGGAPEGAARQEREELLAYARSIAPYAREGGRIVVEGLRPLVGDLLGDRFGDEVLVGMAQRWLREFREVRRGFLSVEAPPFLGDATFLYRQALNGYVNTANALLAAARVRGQAREEIVGLAIRLGEAADDLYDRAEAELDRQRARLGLGPPRSRS